MMYKLQRSKQAFVTIMFLHFSLKVRMQAQRHLKERELKTKVLR